MSGSWYSLTIVLQGHNFAIFGYSLTSGGRYVISVSNKFLTWDLASSEVQGPALEMADI